MENRQLFLRVLMDLEERLQSNDEYDVLNIARLLRQLLLDGSALVHEIVRNQPVPLLAGSPNVPIPPTLQFEILDYPLPTPRPDFWWAILDGLEPHSDPAWRPLLGDRKHFHVSMVGRFQEEAQPPPPDPTLEKLSPKTLPSSIWVKKDAFLKRPVITYMKQSFSVRDIISFLANNSGAVHFARPKDPRSAALDQIMHGLYLQGLPLGVYMLLPIGRAARKGLEPFKRYVTSGPLFQRADVLNLEINDKSTGTQT